MTTKKVALSSAPPKGKVPLVEERVMESRILVGLAYKLVDVGVTVRTADSFAKLFGQAAQKWFELLTVDTLLVTTEVVHKSVDSGDQQILLLKGDERKHVRSSLLQSQVPIPGETCFRTGSVIDLRTDIVAVSQGKAVLVDNRSTMNEITRVMHWYVRHLEELCLTATFDPRLLREPPQDLLSHLRKSNDLRLEK